MQILQSLAVWQHARRTLHCVLPYSHNTMATNMNHFNVWSPSYRKNLRKKAWPWPSFQWQSPSNWANLTYVATLECLGNIFAIKSSHLSSLVLEFLQCDVTVNWLQLFGKAEPPSLFWYLLLMVCLLHDLSLRAKSVDKPISYVT